MEVIDNYAEAEALILASNWSLEAEAARIEELPPSKQQGAIFTLQKRMAQLVFPDMKQTDAVKQVWDGKKAVNAIIGANGASAAQITNTIVNGVAYGINQKHDQILSDENPFIIWRSSTAKNADSDHQRHYNKRMKWKQAQKLGLKNRIGCRCRYEVDDKTAAELAET